MPELKDFIILAIALGLLCLAWSLMLIFWPPEPERDPLTGSGRNSESGADSELDSEATPKGE